MDFKNVVDTLNHLLSRNQPNIFNSSWIRKHAPHCYQFLQQNVRREYGGIDWDRLTHALDRKFQRRWVPAKIKKDPLPYEDHAEVQAILRKYRTKMYVFIAFAEAEDRRTRDLISISFVRLAQNGNVLARQELMALIRYTVDDWIDRCPLLSRWRGYEEEVEKQLEACIRRYRYTGSFINYVFRTLEYAGRGIQPTPVYSPDHFVYTGRRTSLENRSSTER